MDSGPLYRVGLGQARCYKSRILEHVEVSTGKAGLVCRFSMRCFESCSGRHVITR